MTLKWDMANLIFIIVTGDDHVHLYHIRDCALWWFIKFQSWLNRVVQY